MRGWGDGEMGGWGGKILSAVLKKMYFSIHFSPKKAFEMLIHNLFVLSSFMLRKMFIKHSFLGKTIYQLKHQLLSKYLVSELKHPTIKMIAI
ncbi:MAG: hypothetical protein F6K54_39740 [Okeania sp. SIO3B5]|uniref:hypothetical protein n=1 Tax=Okeania sp. SIO3B5 TaxID=2607811 RepID=UPI0014009DD5|nr:hypothetical protein [Okeania sp. SIO3B5]NEO58646.1 hypothetical protein [Okeania sp. SIO3B5]